ncbi:TetR/AcrR family transcriptional regulator [Kroppenstedtia eburnea]|uniref:Transcriptional regulator, TetR family n=1 Tax=Kroppenstedtia eburnea TaxID=714067 RepID=A0A1N7MDP4_9BACL|nr:TetR/AcrR family transcriptional regulator [Kroppenstedtia eburnea]EGK07334.1 TetR family transcriptional regulator [Desmospora sp. 8437]QKI81505.1 TetR/AcrR family transcriptional regulator [Kroppenstedtia eburnea]SIS84131.1 transcriptional regulator, TetR family [Kroppenstedtia eburnea]
MSRIGRREKILEKASQLFRTKGYHGTTIRDISEASGILSGSLYAHIKSKEDLLFEITDRGAELFLRSLRPVVMSEEDPVLKLRKGLVAHIRVITENLEAATVFFHEWKALTEERRRIIQAKRDEYEAMWAELLSEGVNRGSFRLADEKFARLLILSAANGLYQWYNPQGDLSPEEVADRFTTILLSGFTGGEGGENR